MRFIETAFLVIHAGYEGGDIAEKKNNPRFSAMIATIMTPMNH